MDLYRGLVEVHSKADGGVYRVAWFRRNPGESMSGSVVSLTVCVDSSTITMRTRGQQPAKGLIIQETGYFARQQGMLKLVDSEFQVVDKC